MVKVVLTTVIIYYNHDDSELCKKHMVKVNSQAPSVPDAVNMLTKSDKIS